MDQILTEADNGGGGKKGRGARIIAGTAVQDAVIRKCIFTNEVSGMVDGRGEESRNGRKGREGGSKARCGREALVARLGSKSWRRRARPA